MHKQINEKNQKWKLIQNKIKNDIYIVCMKYSSAITIFTDTELFFLIKIGETHCIGMAWHGMLYVKWSTVHSYPRLNCGTFVLKLPGSNDTCVSFICIWSPHLVEWLWEIRLKKISQITQNKIIGVDYLLCCRFCIFLF